MIYNPRKWTAFIIYASIDRQIEIIKKLKTSIKKFDHYNFNYYCNVKDDRNHVSIRVYGKGKEELERKIIKFCNKRGLAYITQPYDYVGRRSYEFGTRCAFLFMDMRRYFLRDDRLAFNFFSTAVHGLLNNIGFHEKAEAKLYRKLWWHFAVRKPYYRFKRRIKNLFLTKHRKNF